MFALKSLAERWPELTKEFDLERNAPLTPDKLRARSFKNVWWTSPLCGHSWRDSPHGRTLRTPRDCPFCDAGGGFVAREIAAEANLRNTALRGGPIVP